MRGPSSSGLRLVCARSANCPIPWFCATSSPEVSRDELLARAFALLAANPQHDIEEEMLQLIKANSEERTDLLPLWLSYFESAHVEEERITWLRRGLDLGVIDKQSAEEKDELLGSLLKSSRVISLLYRYGHSAYLSNKERTFDMAVDAVLAREAFSWKKHRSGVGIEKLFDALNASRFAIAFRRRDPVPLEAVLADLAGDSLVSGGKDSLVTRRFSNYNKCIEVWAITEHQLKVVSADAWATTLEPWDAICEAARQRFGERWAFADFANIASGIRSPSETCAEAVDLLNGSISLCRRVRYARLRTANAQWWSRQFDKASGEYEIALVMLVLLTWASKTTLVAVIEEMEAAQSVLSAEAWKKVFVRSRFRPFRFDRRETFTDPAELPPLLSSRFAAFFASRSTGLAAEVLYKAYFASVDGVDEVGLEFTLLGALDHENVKKPSWNPDLALIRAAYEKGTSHEPQAFFEAWRDFDAATMPTKLAQEIAGSPLKYPGFLLSVAEEACRISVAGNTTPVSSVAAHDWSARSFVPLDELV
jgi:hypothetical protein